MIATFYGLVASKLVKDDETKGVLGTYREQHNRYGEETVMQKQNEQIGVMERLALIAVPVVLTALIVIDVAHRVG